MDNSIVLFLLRAIHVVGGVLWVGGVVVVSLFLLPATQALGAEAQPMMGFIMGRRKLPVYLMTLGILTTLAGLLLMMRNISLTVIPTMRARMAAVAPIEKPIPIGERAQSPPVSLMFRIMSSRPANVVRMPSVMR